MFIVKHRKQQKKQKKQNNPSAMSTDNEYTTSSTVLGECGLLDCAPASWKFASPVVNITASSAVGTSLLLQSPYIHLLKTLSTQADPLMLSLQFRPQYCLLGIRMQTNAKFLEFFFSTPAVAAGELQYISTSKSAVGASVNGTTTGLAAMFYHEFDLPSHLPTSATIHIKFLSLRQPESDRVQAKLVNVLLMLSDHSQTQKQTQIQSPTTKGTTTEPTPTASPPTTNTTTTADTDQQLQQARQSVQAMKASLQEAAKQATSTPATSTANLETILVNVLSQLSIPGSPLQSVLSQLQRTLVAEMNKNMEAQILPVLQRLDRLEHQIVRLSVITGRVDQEKELEAEIEKEKVAEKDMENEKQQQSESVNE
jgi:hypothetical protein